MNLSLTFKDQTIQQLPGEIFLSKVEYTPLVQVNQATFDLVISDILRTWARSNRRKGSLYMIQYQVTSHLSTTHTDAGKLLYDFHL